MSQCTCPQDNAGDYSTLGKILKLVEQQEKDKDAALSKVQELENQLKAAKKDVEMHKCTIRVLKKMDPDEDTKELKENQEKQIEEIEHLEILNQQLMVKEINSNVELTEVRKALITGFQAVFDDHDNMRSIGIKRMGEVEIAPFVRACKRKRVAMTKASKFCSEYQEKVNDPSWYPFEVTSVDGLNYERIIDEEDKTLKKLKSEWGEEAYCSVTTALKEMNEYNASGRTITSELWNYDQERKATLKEVVRFLMRNMITKDTERVFGPSSSGLGKRPTK